MKFYSDVTNKLYETAEACEAAETAFLKAEEEKKNGHKLALAEIDELLGHFETARKEQEAAYQEMSNTAKVLHSKYVEYQRKYGRLPDKHYANYILTRMM